MADLKKLFVGQRLKQFATNTWNKLLAGELKDRDFRRRPSDIFTGAPHTPVVAKLKWAGEAVIAPGSTVKLTAPFLQPGTDEIGASIGLGFHCEAFGEGDTLDAYAITLGPIEPDGVGVGFLPGAWWARVSVTSECHSFATPSGSQLASGTNGLRILWKPTGTGEMWAVVLLHEKQDRSVAADGADQQPGSIIDKVQDTGTFDPELHQKVFFQVVPDSSPDACLGLNNKLQAFTALGGGGGGPTYTPGCGISIVSTTISVDPSDLAGEGLIPDDTTCALHVNVGCGLKIADDKVVIDPGEIAGKGLKEVAGSTCDELELDLGCGLQFDASDKAAVDVGALAGDGLGTNTAGGACQLKVNVGCGLEIVSDTVRVKAADLAGEGLVPSASGCALDVNLGVGCGLDFDNETDTIFFDAQTVAGSGLGVEGVCSLKVNVGCGLAITADTVVVNAVDLAGSGLATEGTCGLKINTGCGLEIASDAVRVKVDPASCLECNGTTGLRLKGDPVTIRSIKDCQLLIENGKFKLKLIYDVFNICGEAGAVDQEEICDINVRECPAETPP